MKKYYRELFLPEGVYRERKDFLFCQFLYTAILNFGEKYLSSSGFAPLKKSLYSTAEYALQCAADGFSCVNDASFPVQAEAKLCFTESRKAFLELVNLCTIYLKMKKFRIFTCDTPVMHRFRSFHIRSLDLFRTWISIERYDSDLLFDETKETEREKIIFYPSSAELAANGLLRMAKCCSYLMARLERR